MSSLKFNSGNGSPLLNLSASELTESDADDLQFSLGTTVHFADGRTFVYCFIRTGGVSAGDVVSSCPFVPTTGTVTGTHLAGSLTLSSAGAFPNVPVRFDTAVISIEGASGDGAGQVRFSGRFLNINELLVTEPWTSDVLNPATFTILQPWDVEKCPAPVVNPPLGVALADIGSNDYGWIQTKGVGRVAIEAAGNAVVGCDMIVASAANDGQVEGLAVANTPTVAEFYAKVGTGMSDGDNDGDLIPCMIDCQGVL